MAFFFRGVGGRECELVGLEVQDKGRKNEAVGRNNADVMMIGTESRHVNNVRLSSRACVRA